MLLKKTAAAEPKYRTVRLTLILLYYVSLVLRCVSTIQAPEIELIQYMKQNKEWKGLLLAGILRLLLGGGDIHSVC